MSKKKKHIIIKISNKGVFYNEKEYIRWSNTNFPPKDNFNLIDRYEVFWKIELVSFDKIRKKLIVEVVDYNVLNSRELFNNQKPKYPIERLNFRALKWLELQQIMNFYTRNEFNEISDSYIQEEKNRKRHDFSSSLSSLEQQVDKKSKKLEFKVRHSLMKTKFKMGFVELEKKINGIPDKIKMELKNDHIIPEFDHVKPFFAKVLGKRKIEITGVVHIDENGKIKKVSSQSEEINQINEALITSVKKLKLRESILHPKVKAIDKSLFTPEEFFNSDEDILLGNTLRKSDIDILNEILKIEEIRNKKQLIYLSGRLQNDKTRLKFTLSSKFGFLFHVKGEEMDHFIWELLDSHATYIWSIEKGGASLEKKFQLLEKEINFIRDQGRMAYLRNSNLSDFIFSKINHESSGSNLKDGFPKWRSKVNEKLV